MEISLTLLVQRIITAKNNEEYETIRDSIIQEMELKGFAVSIENESGDDFDDEDEFYDDEDEFDDDEDEFDDDEDDFDDDGDWQV